MATISDEVRAVFTANTSGLVDGVDRAKKKVTELKRAFNERADLVRGSIMDPSTLVTRAFDKFAGSMKVSAVSIGAAAAGGALLVKTFKAASDFAGQQAEKMNTLSEEMRRSSRVDVFASSADGVDALSVKLGTALEDVGKIKAALIEADPYGFGGGAVGNAQTVVSNAQLALKSAVGLGPNTNFDQKDSAEGLTNYTKRVREQDAVKVREKLGGAADNELNLTRERLTLDRQSVSISELRLERERAINRAKSQNLSTGVQATIGERFDVQIQAQEELKGVMLDRYDVSMAVIELENTGLTSEQKAVETARLRNVELDKELNTRKYVTAEEKRSLDLERQSNQAAINAAQLEQVMKSPRQQARELYQLQRRRTRLGQAQDRLNRTDGLTNVSRDINDNINSGIDSITGLRRAPRDGFLQPRSGLNSGGLETGSLSSGTGLVSSAARYLAGKAGAVAATITGGLSTGGLSSGGLNDGATATVKALPQKTPGINDQSAGKTALDAARATVQAINISNAYLKNISEQMDNLKFA